MTRQQLIDYWRRVEAENEPLRTEGAITPRHRLVYQARLRLRALDPEVKVWRHQIERRETGLLVCSWKRYRLGEVTARIVV